MSDLIYRPALNKLLYCAMKEIFHKLVSERLYIKKGTVIVLKKTYNMTVKKPIIIVYSNKWKILSRVPRYTGFNLFVKTLYQALSNGIVWLLLQIKTIQRTVFYYKASLQLLSILQQTSSTTTINIQQSSLFEKMRGVYKQRAELEYYDILQTFTKEILTHFEAGTKLYNAYSFIILVTKNKF